MAVAYQTQKTGQQPAGFELFDCLGAGEAELDLVLRLLGRDLARRASIVVLRRRIRAHGVGRARLQAEQPARRPVLPLHRRAQSVEAGRGRPLVDARHRADRQRRAAAAPPARQGLSRAQHQRLSAAAGPALSLLHRRRHVRDGHQGQGQSEGDLALDQFAALYRLHAYRGAAVRPQPDAGDRRVDRERRQGLAEADLDARHARRDASGVDRHLPAAAGRRLCQSRRPFRRAQYP